ncbi:hypothetical protein BDW59DRAFT_143928 [Aspergillus cavernicola]|uniref:BTB domain-containing protein n=1 Tax=Aspergillus cavernicola TaxID=176166 RepID=A0ABR4IIG3_9EURO
MSASELTELVFYKYADTLAFIDSPSYRPTWSLQPSSVQSIGHRIHSQRLLETGSPVFQKLFEQRTQERTIKRRGGLPDGFKYIIDLTPPSTDEDAVLFLTELSCPSGIRSWAKAKARFDLPVTCVSGVDTLSLPGGGEHHPDSLPEYSPARHHAGIVHILQVLQELRPQLDTPCKIWTFFALAKMYEIATLPQISTRVASWVYATNNKRFIELHPEITYRMAKGTQCAHLLRDSFSVLVGEEALLLLRDSGAPRPKKQRDTVHGRPQDFLDDDDLQRVQYAGESFLTHIIEQFVELAGAEMSWLINLSMYRNVIYFEAQDQAQREIVEDLVSSLKDFVRATIVITLSQHSPTHIAPKYKLDAATSYPTYDYLNVYAYMAVAERITTRTFWQRLTQRKLTKYDGEASLGDDWHTSLASLGGSIGAFRDHQHAVLRYVQASELDSKAGAFNSVLNPWYSGPRGGPLLQNGTNMFFTQGYFSLNDFIDEAQNYIATFARKMFGTIRPEMTYELTDTLTCLTDKEFRYLPLWAGGCDDGTGGVYIDQIPLAEINGFSAPGPSIHTGSATPSYASYASSMVSTFASTVHGASHRATESHASEVMSIDSEGISEVGNVRAVGPTAHSAEYHKVDDELSLALDSPADDFDDAFFDSDSDSDDTVVIDDHGELSEFEELSLDDSEVPSKGGKGP